MNNAEISIIIPTYNREELLRRAINSVLMQSYGNWELIIIDDGSDDGTNKLVSSYLNDTRIKYYYHKNKGVSSSRNTGIKNASTDYIIFLDSDDEFYPCLIEELFANNFNNYDLTFWQLKKVIDNKTKLWKPVNLGPIFNNITGTFLAGSVCYKKEVLIKAGNFDPKISFGENYELGIRVSSIENLKLKYIAKPMAQQNLILKNRESISLKNRLSSILCQYEKHEFKYNAHPKAKSEINYLIGFILEECNRIEEALERYKISWTSNPFRVKALLKILHLNNFK